MLTMAAGNSRCGQEIAKHLTYRWTSNCGSSRPVKIGWSLPGKDPKVKLPILELSCRQYVPGPHEDTQTIQWQVNGERFSILLPPFAVPDQATLSGVVGEFLSKSQAQIEE